MCVLMYIHTSYSITQEVIMMNSHQHVTRYIYCIRGTIVVDTNIDSISVIKHHIIKSNHSMSISCVNSSMMRNCAMRNC